MLLQAGPITVLYENGFLRYINCGAVELVRMVYFAWRDENWNTAEAIIKNEVIDTQQTHFSIIYDCYYQKKGSDIFHWKVNIAGDEHGEITFEIDGHALGDFLKNRLGFCVLHPIGSYTAQSIEITHSNGSCSQTQFPEYIAADNIFKRIKFFKWQSGPVPYVIDFEGDVFETEDQRNWGDASFKTFCTPLDLPFPVKISKGGRVYQKIVFSPETDRINLTPRHNQRVQISIHKTTFKLPCIGIGASTESGILSEQAAGLIKQLGLDHYCVDVEPATENWASLFLNENENAKKAQLLLAVKLQLSDDFSNEIDAFIALCSHIKPDLRSIVVLSKSKPVSGQSLINYIGNIKGHFPNVPIGAGTDYNFTEINRHRFNAGSAQFINYSIHPQEHAFDDLTLIENIATQAETVKSAKEIYGKKMPVFVSPITLKKRFNPYATNPDFVVRPNKERSDERQTTAFCAVFILGSIKSVTMAGTSSVTFFQTTGDQGIISPSGQVFPVYEALKELLDKAHGFVIDTSSSNPLAVDSLLFDDGVLLIWNYTNNDQIAVLPNNSEINLGAYQIRVIDGVI